MSTTAPGIMVDTLIDWGVDTIFGIPGDGINGIMEALRTRQDRLRFVQVRHEEAAAFMACAHAKYTRKLGVCLAASGAGGIHLLSGPVLLRTSWPGRDRSKEHHHHGSRRQDQGDGVRRREE